MSWDTSEMQPTMNVCPVPLDPTVKVIMLSSVPTVQQGISQLRKAVTIVHSVQVQYFIHE